jgi:hypothetical protein
VTWPIPHPNPADLTSKAVLKIFNSDHSYTQSAADGPGTKPDESVGDKSGDDSLEPIKNKRVYFTESENEESNRSKSSL